MKNISTTAAFIADHIKTGGYDAGDIILTQGYTTQGDNGSARWKATGSIITPSQGVLDTDDIIISDASGNEFELVNEGVNDLMALGGVTAAYEEIAIIAGLSYSQALLSSRINEQTGTAYTTVLTDAGNKTIVCNNPSAFAVTIPPNSSEAYPIGSILSFSQSGSGKVHFGAGTGVTINATPGKYIADQYGFATALQTETNVWLLAGNLSAL